MIKLPKKIKVGLHTIDIKVVDQHRGNGIGLFSRSENTIYILKELSDTQQLVTFFHEVVHAINGELAEVIVEDLGEALGQVLVDNKLLNEGLLEDLSLIHISEPTRPY